MASGPDGDEQLLGAAEPHRRQDIGDAGAAGDQGRPPVDHPVEDGPGLVIAGIPRLHERPVEIGGELGNRRRLQPPSELGAHSKPEILVIALRRGPVDPP
jgi:hypothetical protein